MIKMKQLLAFFLITAFFAFKPASKEETYTVDTKASSIQWIAGKVGGEHEGTLKLSSGSLLMDGSGFKSGSFDIDMRSMTVTDLKGSSNASLLNHLKGEDFFSTSRFPTSTFQILKVTPSGQDRFMITGNLSIKGITNSISFPATLKKQKNTVMAVANNVKVDRTKFDIKYRSKSFFGDIGDKAIDDEFRLNIKLVAKR